MTARLLQGAVLALAGAALYFILRGSHTEHWAKLSRPAAGRPQAPAGVRAARPARSRHDTPAPAVPGKALPGRFCDVRGIVVWSSDSSPVPGIVVGLEPVLAPADAFQAPRYVGVRTGSDGRFTLRVLRNVSYRCGVTVDRPGWPRFNYEQVQPVRIGAGKEPAELRIVLPCCAVRGVGVDQQDNPVSGASVSLTWRDSERVELNLAERTSVQTDQDGHFEFRHVPMSGEEATLDIHCAKRGYLGDGRSRRRVKLDEQVQFRFVLRPDPGFSRIRGVVVDARGRPVEGARVYRLSLSRMKDGTYAPRFATAQDPERSDAEGRFTIDHCGFGARYELIVTAVRHSGVIRRVLTLAERELDPLRIVLGAGDSTLRGTVTGGNGTPMAGAFVTLVDITNGKNVLQRIGFEDFTTDPHGRFEIPLVPGRTYDVGPWQEGYKDREPTAPFKMGLTGKNLGLRLSKEEPEER